MLITGSSRCRIRSLRGTIIAGKIYSLIGSAKMNGLKPKAYLAAAIKAALADQPIPLPHELTEENLAEQSPG